MRPREPRDKALAVNLDPARYGTFAEIGAGQEVVRWFFRVGAAAGTIAKSISAYDMTVKEGRPAWVDGGTLWRRAWRPNCRFLAAALRCGPSRPAPGGPTK